MAIRNDKSVKYYLQRKKLIPVVEVPNPKYEMQTLHPHDEPVTLAPRLRAPESPGTKIVTEAN